MFRESAGFLHDDIPYIKFGQGPPLVMVQGLTPSHDVPTGWQRRWMTSLAAPLASEFTVYLVNRKKGLKPGVSMSDIARYLADAIERNLQEPVFLQGTSTGGSVALQLAIDRPDLVRRLVVTCAACRLGTHGRELQAEMARLIRDGQPRQAWAMVMHEMLPPPVRTPAQPLSNWMAGRMVTDDSADALATLEAEDAFDVEAELPRVSAPTLVIGGGRDPFYPEELFRRTAVGVQDGRAHIFPTWRHGRASTSSATSNVTLGFLLAGLPIRHPHPGMLPD